MKPLTLAEAAQFLRMSRSTLYQRRDIPPYRRPGSRVVLFDQDELEAWLRTGRIGDAEETMGEKAESTLVDFPHPKIYHRRATYR